MLFQIIFILSNFLCYTPHTSSDPSLFWTKVGAIGSWVGGFGSIAALTISIFALVLPYRVRTIINFHLCEQLTKRSRELYAIKIANIGTRPFSVNNVSLLIGEKDIPSQLMGETLYLRGVETFPVPKRLEQGQELTVYLQRDILLMYLQDNGFTGQIGIKADIATERKSRVKWLKYSVCDLFVGWTRPPDNDIYV